MEGGRLLDRGARLRGPGMPGCRFLEKAFFLQRKASSHPALESSTIIQIGFHPLPDPFWPILYQNLLGVGCGGTEVGLKVFWSSAKLGHAFLHWGDFFKKKKKVDRHDHFFPQKSQTQPLGACPWVESETVLVQVVKWAGKNVHLRASQAWV